jgi:thioredoxin 2
LRKVASLSEALQVVCVECDSVNRVPAERDPKAAKCGKCGALLFQGRPVALDTARFHKHVARSDIPIIADFWAAWCGPCRTMAPIFERAAAEIEPRARFVKVDVDAEPQLSAQYNVRSIPALFLFKGGRVASQHAGVADAGLLRRWAQA